MNNDLQYLIDQFLKILHLYSVINRKPKDYGTGDKLYLAEIHTITMVGKNRQINYTTLAEIMGVTRGAISQTIRKLISKGLISASPGKNRKEILLKLSEKGMIVYNAQQSFNAEIFAFAGALYEKAGPSDVELVKNLFNAISSNMQQRVREL